MRIAEVVRFVASALVVVSTGLGVTDFQLHSIANS